MSDIFGEESIHPRMIEISRRYNPPVRIRALEGNVVLMDHAHWSVAKQMFGADKARELELGVWEHMQASQHALALEALRMEIKNFDDFKKYYKHVLSRHLYRYEIAEDTEDRLVVNFTECPFYNYKPLVDEAEGSEWFKILAEAFARAPEHRLKLSNLTDAKGGATKFMCLGDKVCQLYFERKRK